MKIVGCYGFKGGTGRSFLTASMAVLLAGAGHKVLVVDWDLEAPGIGDYLGQTDPKTPKNWRTTDGVLDMIRNFAGLDANADDTTSPAIDPILAGAIPISLRWFKEPKSGMLGKLFLLGPGRQSLESTGLELMNADWVGFHRFSGASFFRHFWHSANNFLRQVDGEDDAKTGRKSFVFIDTRTGYNLPSVNVMGALADEILIFTTKSHQSIQSAAEMTWAIRAWADYYRKNKRAIHKDKASPNMSVVVSRYDASAKSTLEDLLIKSMFAPKGEDPLVFCFPSLSEIGSREMTLMDLKSFKASLLSYDSIDSFTKESRRHNSDFPTLSCYIESFLKLFKKLTETDFFAKEEVGGEERTRWQHVVRTGDENDNTEKNNQIEESIVETSKPLPTDAGQIEFVVNNYFDGLNNDKKPLPSELDIWSKSQGLIHSVIREIIIDKYNKLGPEEKKLRANDIRKLGEAYGFALSPRGKDLLDELPDAAEKTTEDQIDEASNYEELLKNSLAKSNQDIEADDPAAAVAAARKALDAPQTSGDPDLRSIATRQYIIAVRWIAGLAAGAEIDAALDEIERATSDPPFDGPYRKSHETDAVDILDVVSEGGMLLTDLLEDFPVLSSAVMSAFASKAEPVHAAWLQILKHCPEGRLDPLDQLVMLARAADLRCGIAHAWHDTDGRIKAAQAAYDRWAAVRTAAQEAVKPPTPSHLESALTAAVAAAGHVAAIQRIPFGATSFPGSLGGAIEAAKHSLDANLRPGTYPLRDAVGAARQLALLLLDCSRPLEALACALDANQILARSSGFAAQARLNNGSPEALLRAALLMRLGTCYQRLGRPDIAGATWDSAIKLTAGAPVGSFRNYVGNAVGWCKEALHYDTCEFQKAAEGLTDKIQKAGAEVIEPGDGVITYVDRQLFRPSLIQSQLYVGKYSEAQDQSDRMIAELQRRARWDAGSTALLAIAWQGLAEAKLNLGDIPSAKHAAEQSLHEYRCYVELTNRTPVPRAAAALLDLRAALRLGKPPSEDDAEKVAKSARTALGDLVGLASGNPNWWNTPELAAWGDIPRLELAETICLASLMMRAIGKPERAETLVNEVEEEWLKKSGWSAQSSQAKFESDSRSPEPPYWQARLDHVRRLAALCRSPEAPPVGSWFHRYTDLLSPKPASIGEGR